MTNWQFAILVVINAGLAFALWRITARLKDIDTWQDLHSQNMHHYGMRIEKALGVGHHAAGAVLIPAAAVELLEPSV